MRRSLAVATIAVALVSGGAFALDCVNVSRPAPEQSGPGIVELKGNWAYVNFPGFSGWVFVPPGTIPITPGANGNFQNGEGFALLIGTGACGNEARQTEHGIQTGICNGTSEAP
jgi:hypothetical protein